MRKSKILILVRDSLTATQLQDFIVYGEDHVMDVRYRWFISQQAAEIRSRFQLQPRSQNQPANKRLKVHGHQSATSIGKYCVA